MNDTWETLGTSNPCIGEVATAAFDVLAPIHPFLNIRCPFYELGHEITPTPKDVRKVAQAIEDAWAASITPSNYRE